MSTPIQALMAETLGNLKQMIDVDTIVGEPMTTPDGTTVIPVSRVACGFGAGFKRRSGYTYFDMRKEDGKNG